MGYINLQKIVIYSYIRYEFALKISTIIQERNAAEVY